MPSNSYAIYHVPHTIFDLLITFSAKSEPSFFKLGLQVADLLGERFIIGVHFLPGGSEGVSVFGALVLVDSVVVALVEGASAVMGTLDLFHKAGHSHLAFLGLVLQL